MHDSSDLDKVARSLASPDASDDSALSARLDRWLAGLVSRRGSDLLLVEGAPPCIRVDGEVRKISSSILDGAEIEESVLPALSSHALDRFHETGITDSSYRIDGLGRFRINLHRERSRAAAAIRALPNKVPSLKELHLPPTVENLARLPRGLVLLGGAAGSGKSTTLRAALRQAPDIIVVGEMRDPETMRIAVAAAETGHLVFSTLHTVDVASTISRISDSFPLERQNSIRQELAMALAAVHTQILLPKKGGGRIPAAELLLVGYGARHHIRRNALQHLHQEIALTKKKGSFSLEDSLVNLVRQGHVEREDALLCAIHPDDLNILLNTPASATAHG